MVDDQIVARGVRNPRILEAMREIPRHRFVPPPYERVAYQDSPLPIGHGQTISQPYIVALMTELLEPQSGDNVLEIGAGSGYQAAILSRLVRKVTTIERLPAVAELARSNLSACNVTNADVIVADGTLGYRERAPYDGIIVTAATPEIPPPLIDQLADGGRLVAPVGGWEIQELVRLTKKNRTVDRRNFGGVRFVPLIGQHGWGT